MVNEGELLRRVKRNKMTLRTGISPSKNMIRSGTENQAIKTLNEVTDSQIIVTRPQDELRNRKQDMWLEAAIEGKSSLQKSRCGSQKNIGTGAAKQIKYGGF